MTLCDHIFLFYTYLHYKDFVQFLDSCSNMEVLPVVCYEIPQLSIVPWANLWPSFSAEWNVAAYSDIE